MKLDFDIDTKIYRLEFAFGGSRLIVGADAGESSFSDSQVIPDNRVIDNQYGGSDSASPWFAFYEEDCAFPPVYLVRAESWEEAYADFVDALPEADLEDLDDEQRNELESTGDLSGYTYDSNGSLKYTETVMGREIELLSVRRKVRP